MLPPWAKLPARGQVAQKMVSFSRNEYPEKGFPLVNEQRCHDLLQNVHATSIIAQENTITPAAVCMFHSSNQFIRSTSYVYRTRSR